ncbi:MAG: HAD family hydrolase [Pirellulaceae bacterium]
MMRFHVLACDYDGTLATDGRVDSETLAALEALRASGRRLVMVTGRRLEELLQVFPPIRLFDLIVAENGALLFHPDTGKEELFAEPPPRSFVEALVQRGVKPLETGRAIVATWKPHETTVLATIRDMGLGLQIILNKGAVMVLPADVSKATGLAHAVRRLGYSLHNTVGVGDAENDHALLASCACGAAVANSVPALKERADIVLRGDHGRGVCELIHKLLELDLADFSKRLSRPPIQLGTSTDGSAVSIPTYGWNVLIRSPRAHALVDVVRLFIQKLSGLKYQWCAITDGDCQLSVPEAVMLGTEARAPTTVELRHALEDPRQRLILNCAYLNALDRRSFLTGALTEFLEQRRRRGRPHWMIWVSNDKLLHDLPPPFAELGPGQILASTADATQLVGQLAQPYVHFVDACTRTVAGQVLVDARPADGTIQDWMFEQTDNAVRFDRRVDAPWGE